MKAHANHVTGSYSDMQTFYWSDLPQKSFANLPTRKPATCCILLLFNACLTLLSVESTQCFNNAYSTFTTRLSWLWNWFRLLHILKILASFRAKHPNTSKEITIVTKCWSEKKQHGKEAKKTGNYERPQHFYLCSFVANHHHR